MIARDWGAALMNSPTGFGYLATFGLFLASFAFLLSGSGAQSSPGNDHANKPASSCPVTLPRKSPLRRSDMFGAGSAHWKGKLFVGALWPDGTVVFKPSGPGFVLPDGSLSMKFGWYRAPGLRGKLKIGGRRLDGTAPPLRGDFSDYGDTGFQATSLIFPTAGCWEVAGRVAESSLTFVTRVVYLGDPRTPQ